MYSLIKCLILKNLKVQLTNRKVAKCILYSSFVLSPYRKTVVLVKDFLWPVANVLMILVVYFVRHWTDLHLVIGALGLLGLPCFLVLPESPRHSTVWYRKLCLLVLIYLLLGFCKKHIQSHPNLVYALNLSVWMKMKFSSFLHLRFIVNDEQNFKIYQSYFWFAEYALLKSLSC